jgi:hypothetical protein
MVFGVDDIIATGLKIIDKVIPDPAQKEAAKLELMKMQQAGDFKLLDIQAASDFNQTEINKVEAASDSLFKSGWRPAIGWICGFALAYHFILQPFLAFVFATLHYDINLPMFNMDALNTLLMGMLGLGGMRSFDKMKGTTK